MIRYGKMVQNAVVVMSRLAEFYSQNRLISSIEIAENRNLAKPLVAKILTMLSQKGLVYSSPGPGGGYKLSKSPSEITLYDVAVLFEKESVESKCPFGPNWCGHGKRCPLHKKFFKVEQLAADFLKSTSFAEFE